MPQQWPGSGGVGVCGIAAEVDARGPEIGWNAGPCLGVIGTGASLRQFHASDKA